MRKKIVATVATFAMLLSLGPVLGITAGAAEFSSDWITITETETISTSGKYYLASDVTGNITISNSAVVTLDLNGHVLKGTGSGSVITVQSGSTLTIQDSNPGTAHRYVVNEEELWVWNDSAIGGSSYASLTARPAHGDVVIVNGGAVTGGSAREGGGIHNEGTLTLTSGTIIGNKAVGYTNNSANGGGIYTESAVECSGSVVGNIAAGNTEAVSDDFAGGVFLSGTSSKFNLNNGDISFNTCFLNYECGCQGLGGGITAFGGTLNLNGGRITYNSGYIGGGVYVSNCSTITAANCTISNNTAYQGGGISTNKGTGTAKNCTISNNTADKGGGIYNKIDFSITACTVSGNRSTSLDAGGIHSRTGTLTLTDVEIINNHAEGKGGGLEVYNGTVKLYGCKIIGNSAAYADTPCGGGVQYRSGTLTLYKNTVITGNTMVNGQASNLFLAEGKKIKLGTSGNAFTGNAGIRMEAPGSFTKNGSENDVKYFTSDDSAYKPVFAGTTDYLKLVKIYTITKDTVENGTVTVQETAIEGETVTVTATPSSGYAVDKVYYQSAGGQQTEITPVSGVYTFAMPASDVTVTATFQLVTPTIPATPATHDGCVIFKGVTSAYADHFVQISYTDGTGSHTKTSTKSVGEIFSDIFSSIVDGSPVNFGINITGIPSGTTLTGTGLVEK